MSTPARQRSHHSIVRTICGIRGRSMMLRGTGFPGRLFPMLAVRLCVSVCFLQASASLHSKAVDASPRQMHDMSVKLDMRKWERHRKSGTRGTGPGESHGVLQNSSISLSLSSVETPDAGLLDTRDYLAMFEKILRSRLQLVGFASQCRRMPLGGSRPQITRRAQQLICCHINP